MTRPWTILLGCVMAGCTADVSPPVQPGGSRELAPVDARRTQPDDQVAADEPASILTLKQAVAMALLRNPELAQYSWQVRANEARVIQAGLRPNAEASVLVEDVLGTGRFRAGRQAQVTLQLSQTIELGGKRAARVAAAFEARELATREYETKRVEVLANVTRRFVALLAAQHLVALAKIDRELSEQAVEATARRAREGAGEALDERKARIALARARIVAEHAEHELAVARRELAAMWGNAKPRFRSAEGDLFTRGAVPTYEEVTARLAQAPEMTRRLSERQLRQAEVRLADVKRIPSPSIAAGVRRLEGPEQQAFVFGLSVPLPTGDRNQGDRAEARALLAESEQGLQTTEVRLRTVIFGLHQELRHAAAALDAFERDIVPQAETSLSLSRRGFVEGRFSYLELADAQRTLGAVKRERIQTAASYHDLVLEIERLTGAPIGAGSQGEESVTP
jgi:outer membrane protein, heavy metal efflux system